MRMQLTSLGTARIGLLLGALLIAFTANAQEGLRIGVVNATRLFDQAPQTRSATAALEEEFAPRQRELAALQQSLQERIEIYQRDAAVMGETERLNLEREIRDGQRDMQREQNELNEDVNIRRNEVLSSLQQSILQEVQTYANDAGYDLVVADALYFSTAIDITDDVLRGLEASFAAGDGGS